MIKIKQIQVLKPSISGFTIEIFKNLTILNQKLKQYDSFDNSQFEN